MRNVEIKAKVSNFEDLLDKAQKLSGNEATIIKQHDTFYNAANGRLKLRRLLDSGTGELIFYDRPDTEGPKLSSYEKSDISASSVDNLHEVLSKALGTKVDVKKVRYLFLVDQTRVHVDQVEGLGEFMEFEVCLNSNQTLEEGEKIAYNLMDKLGVKKDDLLTGAYADLLQKNPPQL